MTRTLLTSIFGFFLISYSSAQNVDEKRVYTLKECIQIALENNLSIKRSALDLKNTDINLDQSRYAMLPTLNGGGSVGSNWGRSVDPTSNQFTEQKIDNANINASANLVLFNALRVINTIRQSTHEKAAAESDYLKAKNDITITVITFYTSVIFNYELYNNAHNQLKTTQQQLERIKKLEKAGSVPLGNVLDLEAQYATNELNLVQRENVYTFSLLQLKQIMQLPATSPLEIEVPAWDVDNQPTQVTVEQIYDIAKQQMPEIKAVIFRAKSSEYSLKVARGNYYPRISLNAAAFTNYSSAYKILSNPVYDPNPTIGYVGNDKTQVVKSFTRTLTQAEMVEKPFNDQFSDNISKSLSVVLTIPILNGFAARANVSRSKILKQKADINLTDAENKLRQAIEIAYNDVSSASKMYASSVKVVSAREEAFRMTKQRYEAGAINYVDYQISENNLFQAKSDQVRAKYDLIFKIKVLDFYQGKPIDY